MLCRNIWNFPTNTLFQFFRSWVSNVNFVLQIIPEEKITSIEIRWTCWPGIADNSVLEDIGQSLHRHACSVGSSRVLLKPAIESSSVNSEKNFPRMTCTYRSQLIVSLKTQVPIILLALEAHQTPTFTGWSGASWVRCGILWTPVPIILRIYVPLQVKPCFIRKEGQLLIDLAFDDRL
jgi:hypothetical protein